MPPAGQEHLSVEHVSKYITVQSAQPYMVALPERAGLQTDGRLQSHSVTDI